MCDTQENNLPYNRVAREKYLENETGKNQGILWMVREI